MDGVFTVSMISLVRRGCTPAMRGECSSAIGPRILTLSFINARAEANKVNGQVIHIVQVRTPLGMIGTEQIADNEYLGAPAPNRHGTVTRAIVCVNWRDELIILRCLKTRVIILGCSQAFSHAGVSPFIMTTIQVGNSALGKCSSEPTDCDRSRTRI
jgi:hypothetical protein